MKCTTTREQLLTPLLHVERSTGKSLTVPVLSCVLLEVRDGNLSLTATNLEVGVRYTIPVADPEDGRVAVPGNILSHVINSLPNGGSCTLITKDGNLSIIGTGATSRITTQDVEEFPIIPHVADGTELSIQATSLTEALSSVAYCASSSTIKPELASVFVHPQGGTLVAAATDSFRLAEKTAPLKTPVSTDPFLIPAKSVQDLLRVLEQIKDTATLIIGEHQLSVTYKGVYITLRLTQGVFPDYTQIIPKEFVTEATMLAKDLERTLKKASAFSDQFNQTTITVDPEKKQFTIHSENSVVGETTDVVAASLSGDPLEIRFNQRYVSESLGPIHTDSVMFRFKGQSQPALIQPVGDDSFRYIVMPMNR